MQLFQKILFSFGLVVGIAVTITGFFWQGWPIFLGITMMVSSIVSMLGAWNPPGNQSQSPREIKKVA